MKPDKQALYAATVSAGIRPVGRPPTGGPGSRGGNPKQKGIRLPDEMITALEQRAAAEGTTYSEVIRQAVKQYLSL